MKLLFTILFQLISFLIFSQKVKVKGIVVNGKGEPLYSTTVCSKTNPHHYGTTANLDGKFSLIIEKGDSLKFTRIGYSTFHYKVKAGAQIRIEMKELNCIVAKSYSENTWFRNRSGPIVGKVLEENLNDSIVIEPKAVPLKDSVEDEDRVFQEVEIGAHLRYSNLTSKLKTGLTPGIVSKLGRKGGEILFSFRIDKDGSVKDIKVVNPFDKEIDDLVLNNLKNIHFEAAEQNDRTVVVTCEIELFIGIEDDKVFFFIKEFGWGD